MKRKPQHAELIEATLQVLELTTGLAAQIVRLEELNSVRRHRRLRFDAVIDLEAQGRKHKFAVEAELGMSAELLTQLKALWPNQQQTRLLVVALYITTCLFDPDFRYVHAAALVPVLLSRLIRDRSGANVIHQVPGDAANTLAIFSYAIISRLSQPVWQAA
jgi:hypothetical protein